MKSAVRGLSWERLSRLRRQRRVQNAATIGLVILGPALALATFLVLGPLDQGASSGVLRWVLLADLIYVMVLAALVLGRVARMIAARRAQSAGSRLHLRLTGVFTFVALAPTVLVAVFASITVNFGLEGWFSERVSTALGASVSVLEPDQLMAIGAAAFLTIAAFEIVAPLPLVARRSRMRCWTSRMAGSPPMRRITSP